MDTPPQRSKERCTLRYSMSKSYNPSSEELWGMIHLLAERADNFLPSYENDLSLHTLQFDFFLQQWLQVANLTDSELVDDSALHIVRQFRKVVLCHRLAFLHKNICHVFTSFLIFWLKNKRNHFSEDQFLRIWWTVQLSPIQNHVLFPTPSDKQIAATR